MTTAIRDTPPGNKRTTSRFFADPAGLSSTVRITCAAISLLTKGRFTGGHDELLYVIRKPQDLFARVM